MKRNSKNIGLAALVGFAVFGSTGCYTPQNTGRCEYCDNQSESISEEYSPEFIDYLENGYKLPKALGANIKQSESTNR